MAVQTSLQDILDNLITLNSSRAITPSKHQDALSSMFGFFAPDPADLTATGTALGYRLPGQTIPTALSGTVAFNSPLYLNGSGELGVAIPSGTEAEAIVYGFALNGSTGTSQNILLNGILRDDAAFSAFSTGATVYLGSGGVLTTTAPAGSTHYVQPIGRAIGDNMVKVDPVPWAVSQNP